MRIYSASSEEALRARKFLKEWAGEGLLTEAQYRQMEQETASDLRTTNIFLRLVLFVFTLNIVGAAAALFFVNFFQHSSEHPAGIFLLIFAAVCYGAAYYAASQFRLYRYGIEEALAAFSVVFLCGGMQMAIFSGTPYWPAPHTSDFLVPAAGAVFSLWIWRSFGLWYAFPAAMIFIVFLPGYWTSSHAAQHLIVAAFYAGGLAGVAILRRRHGIDYRRDYLNDAYSLAEAFLWLGIYLAFNLRLSSLTLLAQWRGGPPSVGATEFSRSFYWTTWVLIWCLPPVILGRGIREKDRFIIAGGTIAAILTLASNKPYLGWPRQTWDPMLLGALLIGVAVFVQRWLARGPGGVRHGFTAERLAGTPKNWMNAGTTAIGLLAPDAITPAPQTSGPEVRFGGGDSGGGGATDNF